MDIPFDLPTANYLGPNNTFVFVNVGYTFPAPTKLGDNYNYFYGKPRRLAIFANVTSVFSLYIWVLIALSVIVFTLACLFVNFVYTKKLSGQGLSRGNVTKLDIVMKILASLTEPERIHNFPKLSTGSNLNIANSFPYKKAQISISLQENFLLVFGALLFSSFPCSTAPT